MQHHPLTIGSKTNIPQSTAARLVKSFLDRHGHGLDDLLRRFPDITGPAFRSAIERHLARGETKAGLAISLEEACDTLLALRDEDFRALPVDAGKRVNVDAGLRWYAARFHDLAKAARDM
ncbi:hypothetical protein [Litorisediminicola beolgyonensis]|uniref:Uncharacterized protein n=1 Tax=Litorisediminicola beolgyonensis TaxID=1173614 RepID=A0ABW3ZIF7_9RHOB